MPAATDMPSAAGLAALARDIRLRVVEMAHAAAAAHVGSALSCVDLLVAAYWGGLAIDPARPLDPGRDRFILSKGHAAPALYATLAARGFFPAARLADYARDGSPLGEHPGRGCVPGVEASTGSLGHGLALGAGMALAARISGRPSRVCVLLSDGECQEGSVWEGALFAAARRLAALTVVVDRNGWQATGRTEAVTGLEPLVEKWRAFGWEAEEVDGHDAGLVRAALARPPAASGRPRALVARTVKGKGISFMEDDNNWHYRAPTAADVARARAELGIPGRAP